MTQEEKLERVIDLLMEAANLIGWNVVVSKSKDNEDEIEFLAIVNKESKELEIALDDSNVGYEVFSK